MKTKTSLWKYPKIDITKMYVTKKSIKNELAKT